MCMIDGAPALEYVGDGAFPEDGDGTCVGVYTFLQLCEP